jgi:hypothetical protein
MGATGATGPAGATGAEGKDGKDAQALPYGVALLNISRGGSPSATVLPTPRTSRSVLVAVSTATRR